MNTARRILMMAPWDESSDTDTYPPQHFLQKLRLWLSMANFPLANASLVAALCWHTGLRARGANMLFAHAVLAVLIYGILAVSHS